MSVCFLLVCPLAYPYDRTWSSPNFCACCLWRWLGPPLTALWYVMYFRFRGWRHVFTQWALWCVVCIPSRRERITVELETTAPSQILLNDKDQQVHVVGCASRAKPSMYNFLVITFFDASQLYPPFISFAPSSSPSLPSCPWNASKRYGGAL